jgi:hypothetical protein
MMPLYDLYVLSPDRCAGTIDAFMARFGKGMEEAASDYAIPRFASTPFVVFGSAAEAISYLLAHGSEPYAIYYRPNTMMEHGIRNAMLYFTEDNKMIFGITVECGDRFQLTKLLQAIAETVHGTNGYLTVETPPPLSAPQFIEIARLADEPRLSIRTLSKRGHLPGGVGSAASASASSPTKRRELPAWRSRRTASSSWPAAWTTPSACLS